MSKYAPKVIRYSFAAYTRGRESARPRGGGGVGDPRAPPSLAGLLDAMCSVARTLNSGLVRAHHTYVPVVSMQHRYRLPTLVALIGNKLTLRNSPTEVAGGAWWRRKWDPPDL